VAGGPIDLQTRYLETGAFEVVISHNRYTVLNGAVYGGGNLSKGPRNSPRYAYRPAPSDLLQRAHQLEALCARHQVPLAAAALQFSLRDPRIDSTIVGSSRPERVRETVALARYPISEDLWAELGAVRPQTQDLER